MTIAPSEKHLEDWMVAHPDAFFNSKVVARPFKLPAGIVDLILWDDVRKELCVVELKKDTARSKDLAQLLRSIHNLKRIWIEANSTQDAGISERLVAAYPACVYGILVCRSIEDDLLVSAIGAHIIPYRYIYENNAYRFTFAGDLNSSMWIDKNTAGQYAYGLLGELMREALTHYSEVWDGI